MEGVPIKMLGQATLRVNNLKNNNQFTKHF